MSTERWSFWRKRTEELREQSEIVVDVARAAGRDMETLLAGSVELYLCGHFVK